jgi:hypothetical protein
MKRILVLAVAIAALSAAAVFPAGKGSGFAVGGEGSMAFAGIGGLPMSAMLTLHLPQFPVMLGIGVSTPFAIGVTADYWLAQGNLGSIFGWYAGAGGYLSVSETQVSLGGRIPIGLQVWPLGQVFEVFVEVAPAVGLILVPTSFDWHFQGAVGFRFWF